MSVKHVITDRVERTRKFAESLRFAYEEAYKKAGSLSKDDVNVLIKDIPPKVRHAVKDKLDTAQAVFDEINQSLADKAVPPLRKRAVTREQLDTKAKASKAKVNKEK